MLVCNHVSFVDAGAADGGEPAADPLRDGPPHLRACRCSARCSGWPRRSRSRRSAKTRRSTSRRSRAPRGAATTATCLHLSRKAASRRDGELGEFKGGMMKMLETATPVPVVPMALRNLWGSFFWRIEGEAMRRPLRRGMVQPRRAGWSTAVGPAAVPAACGGHRDTGRSAGERAKPDDSARLTGARRRARGRP